MITNLLDTSVYKYGKQGMSDQCKEGGAQMKPNPQSSLCALLTFLALMSFPISGMAAAVVKQDFDNDGKTDILWRRGLDGQNAVWLMNGTAVSTGALITPVADPTWTLAGIGDFNHDGMADILWRNAATGENAIWFMNGGSVSSSALITPVSDAHWTIQGVGDFNGDGLSDILWRNTATGENAIWFINGTTVTSTAFFQTVDPMWLIAGVGDYNNDGMADLLWRQPSTG